MMRGMGNMQGMMKQMQKCKRNDERTRSAEQQTIYRRIDKWLCQSDLTGDKTLQDITINEAIVDADDVEMLQDMIILAVNDGLKKIEKESEQTMGKYTRNIPGL